MTESKVLMVATDLCRKRKYDHYNAISDALKTLNHNTILCIDSMYIPSQTYANEGSMVTNILYNEEKLEL